MSVLVDSTQTSFLINHLQSCATHNEVPFENITMLISPYALMSEHTANFLTLSLYVLCVESATKRELPPPPQRKRRGREDIADPNIVSGSAMQCIDFITALQEFCATQSPPLPQPQLVFASNLCNSVLGMVHIAKMLENIEQGYRLSQPPVDVYFLQYVASTTPLSYHEKAEYRDADLVYKKVAGRIVCSMFLHISDHRLTLAGPAAAAPAQEEEETPAVKEEAAAAPAQEEAPVVKEEAVETEPAAPPAEPAAPPAKPKRRRSSRPPKKAEPVAETEEEMLAPAAAPAAAAAETEAGGGDVAMLEMAQKAEPEAGGGDVATLEMAQEAGPTQPMAVDAM